MGNIFGWPIVRLIQRLAMILTLGCCVYVIVFLLSKSKDNSMSENSSVVSSKETGLLSPSPVFDLKPYDAQAAGAQSRDIFSLAADVSPSGAVENTPKGQLPDHLKIVGILIGHPSQVIIEDEFSKKTYFIDEGNPQGGIKIVQVSHDQMVINYQGQNIFIPVNKN
jgi:type II secretory pathway component PulC